MYAEFFPEYCRRPAATLRFLLQAIRSIGHAQYRNELPCELKSHLAEMASLIGDIRARAG